MLLQRGAVLPRKSAKKPRPTPVARGVITGSILGDIAGSQYEFPITRPTRLDWRYCNLFTDRCKFTDNKLEKLE